MCLLKFKALSDKTRLRLLSVLSRYELSVNELVQILDMGQSRISRHLKILTEAGLLQARRDGLWVFYSTPATGANTDFIRAVLPFLPDETDFHTDISRAANMLAERAKRAKQFFNSIAGRWDELNREILGQFDLGAHIAAAIPQGCETAVDLGCGTGAILPTLIKNAKKIIGVDGSSAMLDHCRNRLAALTDNPGVSLRIGDLTHLPLADREANFACISLVLHHLPDPKVVFAEIRRILAPLGILFIADFLKHDDETMRTRYGDHWLGFEQVQLETWLTEAGFSMGESAIHPLARSLKLVLIKASLL